MIHTKHQGSSLVVSDKKIFSRFPYISLCITCDPRGGPIFVPGASFEQTLESTAR